MWNCNWSLDRLKRALQIWWQDKCSNEYSIGKEDAKVLFPLAVELFLIFVQNNFTGPFDHVADFEELINKLDFDYGKFDKFSKSGAFDVDGEHIITANDMLKTNNEEVNANVKLSALLVCARDIFRCLMKYDSECLVCISFKIFVGKVCSVLLSFILCRLLFHVNIQNNKTL